jgi:hypothetical protein
VFVVIGCGGFECESGGADVVGCRVVKARMCVMEKTMARMDRQGSAGVFEEGQCFEVRV